MYYIGIDLGTSAVKLMLTDARGRICGVVSREYPIFFPHDGWSEQSPADWRSAVLDGMRELIRDTDKREIAGIGVAGQMHGLVILDDDDSVIRPAILWNDGRTEKEVAYLNDTIGKEKLLKWTANIAFAGFTAPKLLWLRKNEPDCFHRIAKIMLPKDYINYVLTGEHCTDFSDAAGTLLLDVEHRLWSREMMDVCGVSEKMLPRLCESFQVIGTLKPDIAAALGLPPDVKVCAGAGDNAAAAIGTGTVGDSSCNISLGTSGTIFLSTSSFHPLNCGAIHSFAHADGGYHLMACMLSAASCLKWFQEDILSTADYGGEQARIRRNALGRNRVFFLPYLMGERSPINDAGARGVFLGMSMDSGRADMLQAVLEGVAFALRDSLDIMRGLGIDISSSRICGGGAQSRLWAEILSNVLGLELCRVNTDQGPGLGAAMLAMTACGEYESVASACESIVRVTERIQPDERLTSLYNERYGVFRRIYPACKEIFPLL